MIAPSASVAKHAVDSLKERDHEFECNHYAPFHDSNSSHISLPPPAYATTAATAVPESSREKPTPVLVFSSDTVLGRQSFQMNRRPSLALDEVVGSLVEPSSPPFSLAAKGNNVFNDGQFEQGGGIETIVSDAAIPISQTQERVDISSASLSSPQCRPNFSLSPDKRARLHGHILICGPFDQSYQLASYLTYLHAREAPASEPRPTIVLLVKTFPSDDDFSAVPQGLHANVFIDRGVSQNVEDLLRVRGYDAASVLLIPGNWDEGGIAVANMVDLTPDWRPYSLTPKCGGTLMHEEALVGRRDGLP